MEFRHFSSTHGIVMYDLRVLGVFSIYRYIPRIETL